MRLIDADALIKALNGADWEDMRDDILAEQYVDYAPTVDATPVTRGNWLDFRYYERLQCSNCKKVFTDESNFCPSCGAKKEVKDE